MLTPTKQKVLNFINGYAAKKGFSPSLEEIRNGLRLSSISTIHQHVRELEKTGHLTKKSKLHRSIEIPKHQKIINISIIGTITAGQPLEAIEYDAGSVIVPSNTIGNPKNYYALKVRGDSMIDEGIFDGDIVIIKKQSVAENGQTVVAIIDDNEATLKKIYRENGRFRLQPRNQNLLPFFRKEVEIRGVVVQIISPVDSQREEAPQTKTKPKFRTIDLFAGVGGLRLGFEKAGFKTMFANDFEPQCKNTYDLNFKTSKLVVEDIRRIGINDLPKFDFLLAGFPCQPFSVAGYRDGFKDKKERGNLFFDLARIIEARKPEGFLLENVKNLKSHDHGKTFEVIEDTLKRLGYHIHAKVLNSTEYGNVPQNRERLYIVGFKNKTHHERFKFPNPIKLTAKMKDFFEKNVSEKYYYNGKPLFNKLKNHVKEGGVYQWRRKYVRENKKGVCPTLTANMGMGGHNVPIIKDRKGIRKLTPLECARLQGFPMNYKLPAIADSALYKQFGNSVTVPVIARVAEAIKNTIES